MEEILLNEKNRFFIIENLLGDIKTTSNDNKISVLYKETRLVGCRIFLSKIVGFVHFKYKLSKGLTLSQGDYLLYIEELKILNDIFMEESGKVEAIYVEEGQFVMYGTPLVLIRVK